MAYSFLPIFSLIKILLSVRRYKAILFPSTELKLLLHSCCLYRTDSYSSNNKAIIVLQWGLGLGEEENKIITDNANNTSLPTNTSGNVTPTNTPPVLTPRLCPSPIQANPILIPPSTYKNAFNQLREPRELESGAFSDASSNASSVSETSATNWRNLMQSDPMRPSGTFRSLATGLDPIPEDGVSNPPAVYQPLVPPPITKPVTTSYNISFPTTLQPRDRFDLWSAAAAGSIGKPRCGVGTAGSSPEGASSSSVPPSPGSLSNQQVLEGRRVLRNGLPIEVIEALVI